MMLVLLIHYFVLTHPATNTLGWWQTILTSQTVAYRRLNPFLFAIAHSSFLFNDLLFINLTFCCIVEDQRGEQHLDVVNLAVGLALHGLQVLHAVGALL